MDGSGVRAGCIRIRCPSPGRAMARFFTSKGNKKKKNAMAESRVKDCDSIRIRNFSDDDRHGDGQSTDSPPRTIDSELQGKEFLFSIGVTCYLLHLIANGREEIHKIADLRNDLEKLVECQNDEMRRKHQEFVKIRDNIERLLEFHNDELRRKQHVSPFGQQEQCETTSDVVDGPESSTDHYHSPQFLETSFSVGREGSLKHYVCKGGEEDYGGQMDQLEAELEAELELLQIGQDHEGNYSKLKEVSDKGEDSSEDLRFRHMCSGPMDEQQGVCPYELERRLYELMETRQEEEINELQTALEDAKKRLHVKEAEASWWKDTAYIVSEHIPKPCRINSNSQTRCDPLSRQEN